MRGGRTGVIAAAALLSAAGCTSSSTTLSTVSTSAPAALATSTSSTAPPSPSTSVSSTAGPATTLTVERLPLPATVATEARPVADAWFAYWDFVGQALSDPARPQAVEGVGKVATGTAASDLVGQITGLKAANQRIVGQLSVAISSASVAGVDGSVCSSVKDISYPVDTSGKPAAPGLLRNPVFAVQLALDGPLWRVKQVTRQPSC